MKMTETIPSESLTTSLEFLLTKALKKHNKITLKDKLSHCLTVVSQNKLITGITLMGGYLVYLTGKSMYHDFFVANNKFVDYLLTVKNSLYNLANNLGSISSEVIADKTAVVKNSYVETLTNSKFALEQIKDVQLNTLVDSLNQNNELFSGKIPGEVGLIKVNELKPTLNELIKQYTMNGTWSLLMLPALLFSIIGVPLAKQFYHPDDEYKERKNTIVSLDERITNKLPILFEQLKNCHEKSLICAISLQYLKSTKNVEATLDFLFASKEISNVILSNFENTFGFKEVNNKISPDELEKFVEDNLQKAYSTSGFDYGEITFDSIGGYEDIKEKLKIYASIFSDPDDAIEQGVEGVTGIILEGPPGTGKTILAQAFINEALKKLGHKKRAHHKVISAADMRSMWYSKNEQNVQKEYREARRKAPFIIFIDEGEELFAKRGEGHSADTAGTNQLLTEIGGVKRHDKVLTIITTNRSESMDDAAKRYGRLGLHITVDVPNYEGRKNITKIHLSRLGRENVVEEFDFDRFAKETDGYTGADIAGIISATFMNRYQEIKLKNTPEYMLNTEHFLKVAEEYAKTVKRTKVGF